MNKPSGSFQSVLCIDDDDEYNFLTQEAFYDYQYKGELTFFTSGEEAMKHLEQADAMPDFIILDINMPSMNGWDFLDEFESKALRNAEKIHIFMHSSSVFDSDRERASTYKSVRGFIAKPILQEDIEMIAREYFSS